MTKFEELIELRNTLGEMASSRIDRLILAEILELPTEVATYCIEHNIPLAPRDELLRDHPEAFI